QSQRNAVSFDLLCPDRGGRHHRPAHPRRRAARALGSRQRTRTSKESRRGRTMIDRRDALKLALGSATALAAPAVFAQTQAKPRTKIVFLGTKGGPRVGVGPSNPANLVMVNGTPFVIDCGMGVSHQLASAGVPLESVKYIFISHHHSDHN